MESLQVGQLVRLVNLQRVRHWAPAGGWHGDAWWRFVGQWLSTWYPQRQGFHRILTSLNHVESGLVGTNPKYTLRGDERSILGISDDFSKKKETAVNGPWELILNLLQFINGKKEVFAHGIFLVPYLTFAKTIWWKMRRRGIPLGFLFRLGGVDILYSERVTEIWWDKLGTTLSESYCPRKERRRTYRIYWNDPGVLTVVASIGLVDWTGKKPVVRRLSWTITWAASKSWRSRMAERGYDCTIPSGKIRQGVQAHWIHLDSMNIWVCLKIGYIPNYSHLIGIMIINHWV